jgi:hypothetical protein
LYDYIK